MSHARSLSQYVQRNVYAVDDFRGINDVTTDEEAADWLAKQLNRRPDNLDLYHVRVSVSVPG